MSFMQQFVMEHPGYGLGYFAVGCFFTVMLASILLGGPSHKNDKKE